MALIAIGRSQRALQFRGFLGDRIEQAPVALLAVADRPLQGVALDGVGDDAPEGLLVHRALDDIFLRAGADGIQAQAFVFVPGQENDGGLRGVSYTLHSVASDVIWCY